MKIKISNVDIGIFQTREKYNEEHFQEIKLSLEKDGQWNPIIVRRKENGKYDLISGHYRTLSAKDLGWEEIEATVKDLDDDEADILSLKTNLKRSDMTPREQGIILNKIMTKYEKSPNDLVDDLGVSKDWISKRLKLALELHEDVVQSLENNEINFAIATIISSISRNTQPIFLKIIINRKITQMQEATVIKRIFLNDTIYSIGYSGKNISSFIKILKDNEIKNLIDVRYSVRSEKKPQFNGELLENELKKNKINYIHVKDLGIPYNIQKPYKEGYLGFNCLKSWYVWQVEENIDFDKFIETIKKNGKTALMCVEPYAKKKGIQKYNCHRDILADLVLEYKNKDKLMEFDNRLDL